MIDTDTNTDTDIDIDIDTIGEIVQDRHLDAKDPDPADLARTIADIAADKKAENILVLDIRSISVIADYFVICTGTSDRQVRAIAKDIDDQLSKQDIDSLHIEGMQDAQWILMDYGSVLAHVFDPDTRDFYKLEKLWAEAPRVLVIQ